MGNHRIGFAPQTQAAGGGAEGQEASEADAQHRAEGSDETAATTCDAVEPFTRDVIQRILDRRDVNYLRDRDGDFLLEYGHDEKTGRELRAWLCAMGEDGNIYSVIISSDLRFPWSRRAEAVAVCNEWNSSNPWPRAYVGRPAEGSTTATITLCGDLGLAAVVHEQLLDDFTDCVISGSIAFWVWATSERHLGAARPRRRAAERTGRAPRRSGTWASARRVA